MIDFKALLTSKTIHGILIALLGTAATYFGWNIGDMNGVVELVLQVGGGLWALYGKIVSVTRIIK